MPETHSDDPIQSRSFTVPLLVSVFLLLLTVAWSLFADWYGRRRTISTMAVLMALGGLLFAGTDRFAILVLAGFTGTISATNSEVGVFQAVDRSPSSAEDARALTSP